MSFIEYPPAATDPLPDLSHTVLQHFGFSRNLEISFSFRLIILFYKTNYRRIFVIKQLILVANTEYYYTWLIHVTNEIVF